MYMKYFSFDFFHTHRRRLRRHIRQFLRYISVGGLMLGVNLLIVWLLVQFFWTHYLLACGIAFVVESLVAFFVNKSWTFGSQISFKKGFKRFFIIGFYTTILVLFITYGFTHYLAMHYVSARTTSTVIMGVIGYFMDMRLAFRV